MTAFLHMGARFNRRGQMNLFAAFFQAFVCGALFDDALNGAPMDIVFFVVLALCVVGNLLLWRWISSEVAA